MKVLSIQSHVVFGYVGNKCAVFPLQVLGIEVDPLNSVQFSNRVGYKACYGKKLNEVELEDLMAGLSHNTLDGYSYVLTGFVGNPKFLEKICEVVEQLKRKNRNLIFICDPVMGDNGKMYVSPDLLPIYKNKIIPLANIITPNQFELELLTERKIHDVKDAVNCMNIIHGVGVECVVMTSSDLGRDSHLICLASSKKGGKQECLQIVVPRVAAMFAGTGDLFSSLFLAWYSKTGDMKLTLERVTATIQAVLGRTYEKARLSMDGTITATALELRLIQSRLDIENPVPTLIAEGIVCVS